MKKLISVLLVLVLTLSLFGCKKQNDSKDNSKPNSKPSNTSVSDENKKDDEVTQINNLDENELKEKGSIELSKGVYLVEVKPYTGAFFENGTDKKCTNVISAEIVNLSSEFYQIYNFTVGANGLNYTFEATTLYPNSKMTVLEKNAQEFPKLLGKYSAKSDCVIEFSEKPSVMLDTFKITYLDGVINAQNISKKDMDNVYVYYKNVDANGNYIGGITYRSFFGEIKSGQTVQSKVSKFKTNSSKIVFVSCVEVK